MFQSNNRDLRICSSQLFRSIFVTMVDSAVVSAAREALPLAPRPLPLPTHPSQRLSKQRTSVHFIFLLLCWFSIAQLSVASLTKDELLLKISQKHRDRSTQWISPQMSIDGTSLSHFHRRDQTDPCDSFGAEANTCLLQADPTCDNCVMAEFDLFLTTIDQNFTCMDFTSGICPIVYQKCTCSPCHAELESYFNCLLNDVRDNVCPTVYCDPLKDFDATPAECLDEVLPVSDCVSVDCLSCLDDNIVSGVTCPDFEDMSCSALYSTCISCLHCLNVVYPWLNCLAQESFQCDPLDCLPSAPPSAESNTTAPTPVPQIGIIDTPVVPMAPLAAAPMAASPVAPAPTMDRDASSSLGHRVAYTLVWSHIVVLMYLVSYCYL